MKNRQRAGRRWEWIRQDFCIFLGATGRSGPSGPTGPRGDNGSPGRDGATGNTGRPGPEGRYTDDESYLYRGS